MVLHTLQESPRYQSSRPTTLGTQAVRKLLAIQVIGPQAVREVIQVECPDMGIRRADLTGFPIQMVADMDGGAKTARYGSPPAIRRAALMAGLIGMCKIRERGDEKMCSLRSDPSRLLRLGKARSEMKNIQVIDGAENSEYAIYEITDEQFAIIFPAHDQNVEFIEDVIERLTEEEIAELFEHFWDRRVDKPDVVGIHGTLFYELLEKKQYYPTKNDRTMIGTSFHLRK